MSLRNWRFPLILLATISLGAARTFGAAPTISVFSPTSGVLYSTVTITGTNFVAPVTVDFNGVASPVVTLVSSTSVKAAVPLTASTGTITVVTSGGSATSVSAFTVVPGLAETPVTVGPPTTSLTLFYSGFGAYEAVDVYFDTEDIALSSASPSGAGNIAVTVPADAHPGVHWVTAVGRRSSNSVQVSFTVRTSWPQLGFTPTHKSKNHYENVLSTASVVDLDAAWLTQTIGDMESTPAVVNGIVYATFSDGTIRAFDETTGAQEWTYQTGGSTMYSSPAVSNGIVYAGSSDYSLYALNAVTGKMIWSHATGGVIYSSPNVTNGIVYFGSYDDKVYALNAATGAVVWTFTAGGPVYSSPMVSNGILYVGSYDDKLYALYAISGQRVWSFATTASVLGSPVLVGGYVCVGSNDGNMYAFDPQSEQEVWTYSAGAQIEGCPAAVGGAIFFGAANGTVYSLSSKGAVLWSTPVSNLMAISSPVCVANGVVYVTTDGYTYALDQSKGDLLTTLPVGSSLGGATVVNGAVFTGEKPDHVLVRYTPNGLLSNYIAPRPDPMQLRPHDLR